MGLACVAASVGWIGVVVDLVEFLLVLLVGLDGGYGLLADSSLVVGSVLLVCLGFVALVLGWWVFRWFLDFGWVT